MRQGITLSGQLHWPRVLEYADVVLVHDPDFRQAEKDWHSFVENMTETLITIDDTIPELPIKDVVSVLAGLRSPEDGGNNTCQT